VVDPLRTASAIRGMTKGRDRDLFAGAAESALPVLGFGRTSPGVDALSPALHGLYWLTANLSERSPLALVVDDAQWADPALMRFLYYLAGRVTDVPVLLVLAIRSDDPAAHEREAVSWYGSVTCNAGTLTFLPPIPGFRRQLAKPYEQRRRRGGICQLRGRSNPRRAVAALDEVTSGTGIVHRGL
jgi:hypothetical protein